MRCVLALLALTAAAHASAPLPVSSPRLFVSRNYLLTFQTPPATTYCRLPEDWTGSDHGTIVFLTPPASCGGAGYPSSSRGFEPETTPRIEVYYGHWDAEIEPRQGLCRRSGGGWLLGRRRTVCRVEAGQMSAVEVRGRYPAFSEAAVTITLVTSRDRLRRDRAIFAAVARTLRGCTVRWTGADGRAVKSGEGRPCPAHGSFY